MTDSGPSGQPARPIARASLTEAEGSALLKVRFEQAGYAIEAPFAFSEEGVDVELDGFDPDRRVGYEFITTEAGDRASFTPEVVAKLEARMEKGELYLLLVDEADVDADALGDAAARFLETVARMQGGGR